MLEWKIPQELEVWGNTMIQSSKKLFDSVMTITSVALAQFENEPSHKLKQLKIPSLVCLIERTLAFFGICQKIGIQDLDVVAIQRFETSATDLKLQYARDTTVEDEDDVL